MKQPKKKPKKNLSQKPPIRAVDCRLGRKGPSVNLDFILSSGEIQTVKMSKAMIKDMTISLVQYLI